MVLFPSYSGCVVHIQLSAERWGHEGISRNSVQNKLIRSDKPRLRERMTRETDSLERRIIPGNKSGGGSANGPCCDLNIGRCVYAFLSTSEVKVHRCPKRIGNETNYSMFLTHGGGCAYIIAEPLWRWLSGGKACFMTKDRFKSMV